MENIYRDDSLLSKLSQKCSISIWPWKLCDYDGLAAVGRRIPAVC